MEALGERFTGSYWPLIRRLLRLLLVLGHIVYGLLLALVVGAYWQPYRPRVRWAVKHWVDGLLRLLGVQCEVRGEAAPGTVFLVSNHVSWLDIPLIASQRQVHFLSKAEVRDWPLIGWLAAAAGTLYIRRGGGESGRKGEEIAAHLRAGRTVLVFPEGTTTEGRSVRRFFPQLFRAPQLAGVPMQTLALSYIDEQGQIDSAAAFIGDDSFQQHLWRLLLRDRIRVRMQWGELQYAATDLDLQVRASWQQVSELLRRIS